MEQPTHQEAVQKLNELMKGFRIAMLTSLTPAGHLHSRPMATQQIEFDGDIWFFTAASSPKVAEIEADARVNVAFSSPDKQEYISASGIANLVRDKAKIEELWNPSLEAWFPKGLDDPDLALLKVTVDEAEYWDSPASAVAHLIGFVKSKVTGKQADVGDHARVSL